MMNTLPTFLVDTIEHTATDGQINDNFPGTAFTQRQINLAEYVHTHHTGLILYFYPKDNTAGCSVQAQDFSQHLHQLHQLGYQVMGVSRDSLASHKKFIINKAINFPLISDTNEQLCTYFDIIDEKQLYGKISLGVVRSTLVFDPTGKLIHELRNVRAKGHIDSLLSLLQNH